MNWKSLGSELGFSTEELDAIDHANPQNQFKVLLGQWLEWYPGDRRGSTSFATYTALKSALMKAGLGDVVRDLPTYSVFITEKPEQKFIF